MTPFPIPQNPPTPVSPERMKEILNDPRVKAQQVRELNTNLNNNDNNKDTNNNKENNNMNKVISKVVISSLLFFQLVFADISNAIIAPMADVGVKEFLVKDGKQFLRLTIPIGSNNNFKRN